ncbi:MAG: hypothetical protein H0U74_00085 [Bradymonadaceae bacterium]|nr:hypothetical protein [Lujinxingiaceae bacterium]
MTMIVLAVAACTSQENPSGGEPDVSQEKDATNTADSSTTPDADVDLGPHPDLVEFSSEEVGFIIGPQVTLGTSLWPFFDENMAAKAKEHRDAAVAAMTGTDGDAALNSTYYDLALSLYALHARSSDPVHLEYARDVAAAWWESMPARVSWDKDNAFGISPRNASVGGLVLYAMEGGGTEERTFDTWENTTVDYNLWGWLTDYARNHYFIWIERALDYPNLWFGVRDGAYTLLLMAHLAEVHPDEAVRAEFREKSLKAARDYYARLQHDDGGWYWDIDDEMGPVTAQPFMIGMLMEAMTAVHQLTADEAVGQAIVKAADWLWEKAYEQQETTNLAGVHWRAMKYFVFNDGRVYTRESAFEYGMEDGAIRDARQLNSTSVHTFGYAFLITGDVKYRERGDDIFSASYGKGRGPGSDAYWGLADFRTKEFNQSYRSGGRYLAWRLSHP